MDTNYNIYVSLLIMRIFIKTLTKDDLILYNCESSDTILKIKQRLEGELRNMPADGTRLLFNGKQLEDCRTLADYNIQQNMELLIVKRLRGGMHHITSGRKDYD